ncbi:hypothetical protein [Streptomyces sp. NBC_00454]|uniref:LppU/SCO3897 family protein n=1 Tax=Streptomyces sp. NBC_00454 TaxID=2975747 RepID=UPI0030E04717
MTTPPPSFPVDPQPVSPAAPAEAAAPAKKGGTGKKILRVVALIVVAGLVKFGISYFFNAPVQAKVGDCVSVTGSDTNPKVSTKECGDKDANFKVVKVVDNTFDLNACGSTGEAALAQQWKSEEFVLCLNPIKA